jgi:hypothetical protein
MLQRRVLPQYVLFSQPVFKVKGNVIMGTEMVPETLVILTNSLPAVQLFRRLVTGLLVLRPGFVLGSVHVGFVVGKVALGQVYIRVLRFSLPITFHNNSPCSYIISR